MKFLTLLSCFFLCGSITSLQAQNKDSVAIRRYYEENAILWTGSNRYYKNNQAYPLKNLKEEFSFSKEASWEFAQYKKSGNTAMIGFLVSEGLLVSSFFVKDRNTRYALLAGSVVSLAITIPISVKSRKHFHKSIWAYNRDILLR